jgi:uncharacterized membrane protein
MTALTFASVSMRMDAVDWFLMAFGLLVFAALLLWAGATHAGDRHTGGEAPSEEASALHLLDRRLARGEITAEEHERIRQILARERAMPTSAESEGTDVLA